LKSAPHPARIALDTYYRFIADDGWAIASHIALSALMALFPFLIVVTSLAASALGSKALADEVAKLLLEAWPEEVAGPIANEIHKVLTTTRGDVLTVGVALAVYFASSGIESLRIGLNRAYGMMETRNWFLLRLESIGYVLIAAVALLALAFLIVLGPLLFATALKYAPYLAPLEWNFTVARYAVTSTVLVVALLIAHKWLAGGPAAIRRHPSRHRRNAAVVARECRHVRPLSRRVRLYLRHLLCRPCVSDDRAGVLVLDGVDLRLRRRAQCRDLPGARSGARRRSEHRALWLECRAHLRSVSDPSSCESARGPSGLAR